MTTPDFAGAESPAHPRAEQEFREGNKLPNPPLLGASRDEIARIINPQVFRWHAEHPGRGWDKANCWADTFAKADQILALPAFAGLLTPSLSHEEEVKNGQWTEPRHGPSEDARPELPGGDAQERSHAEQHFVGKDDQ